MARYSSLPAEIRLAIMEALVDKCDFTGLHRLITASREDAQLSYEYRESFLGRVIDGNKLAFMDGKPHALLRSRIAYKAMAWLDRPMDTPLRELSYAEHLKIIEEASELQEL